MHRLSVLPVPKSFLFSLTLLTCSTDSLLAQSMPVSRSVIWDGRNVILPGKNFRDKNRETIREVSFEGLDGNVIKKVAMPQAPIIKRDYLNGVLYSRTVRVERDDKNRIKLVTNILWRWEANNWQIDATIDSPDVAIIDICPLSNGKYMLKLMEPEFDDENRLHLFGIYKKNKKNQLELDRPLTEPFSERFLLKMGEPGDHYICRSGSKIIFYYPRVGWFIVFDSENGRYLRKGRVFAEITEDALLEGRQFAPVGGHIEPRQDGNLVFVTWSKKLVTSGMDIFPDPTRRDIRMSNDEDIFDNNFQTILMFKAREAEEKRVKRWPELVWWEFIPDTGRSIQIPTPDGFPEKFNNINELQKFHWRIKADDTLLLLDNRNGNPALPTK